MFFNEWQPAKLFPFCHLSHQTKKKKVNASIIFARWAFKLTGLLRAPTSCQAGPRPPATADAGTACSSFLSLTLDLMPQQYFDLRGAYCTWWANTTFESCCDFCNYQSKLLLKKKPKKTFLVPSRFPGSCLSTGLLT